MIWKNETITEMGLLSQMAYLSFGNEPLVKGQLVDQFTDDGVVYYLDKTYTVIDYTDTSSDMQALLLKNGDEYVIAFRGTAGLVDIAVDAVIGLGNINAQYTEALAFVNNALGKTYDGVTVTKDNLTLTGHSLGGILTQQVGAALELDGYAFNPYGVDRLLTTMSGSPDLLSGIMNVAIYQIMNAVGLGPSAESWAKDHILNVSYNDFGALNGDILSNVVTELTSNHIGAYIPIHGANEGLNGHSMAILNAAIEHYNNVLAHFSDKNYQLLTAAYVSTQSYEKTESIFNDLGIYNASDLSFNFLVDDSASDIASQAKGDNTVLYALLNLNPFAIVGNLPAYSNLDPNDYSEQFYEDSANYLYYSIDPGDRFYNDINNADKYYEAVGEDALYFWYEPSEADIIYDRFLWGGNKEDDILQGGRGDDHIYGMGEDDIILGNSGDDYIEGGMGNDDIDGGAGDDTIYTNANIDSQYDDEDETTFNTVIAGTGKDTVHGSNGVDTSMEIIKMKMIMIF